MTDSHVLSAAGLTVMNAQDYSLARFDMCQQIAEDLGFQTFGQWTDSLERSRNRMPEWYWKGGQQNGPEHHYCEYVAGLLAWESRRAGMGHLFATINEVSG